MSRSFNGSTDRLDWDSINDLTSDPITISAWLYNDGVGAARDTILQIHQSGDAAAGIEFCLTSDTNGQFLRTGATSLYRNGRVDEFSAFTGGWHHILVTHDGTFNDYTTIHMYRDGTEFSYTLEQNGATERTISGSWSIGGRIFDDARNFDGLIAEVGVWDRVLSAGEIAALAAGQPPSEISTNLVFNYSSKFDNTTAETGGAAATVDGTSYSTSHPTMILQVSVSDTVTVGESVQASSEGAEGETLVADVSDSITVTDTPAVSLEAVAPLNVSVSDTVTIIELPFYGSSISEIAVSDTVTITDAPAAVVSAPQVAKTETITVTDTPAASVTPHPTLEIGKEDTITVTDAPALEVGVSQIIVGDTVTVDDAGQAEVSASQVNVSDEVTVTDAPEAAVLEAGQINVSVSDNASVTDEPALEVGASQITVDDTITVSEDVAAAIASLADRDVTVSDTVSLSDEPTPTVGASQIDVDDMVTLSEDVAAYVAGFDEINASVTDNIQLSESVACAVGSPQVDVDDTVILSENVTVSIAIAASVSDTVTLADAPAISPLAIGANVGDTVTLADAATLGALALGGINVSDTVSVTDIAAAYFVGAETLVVNAVDAVIVSESRTVLLPDALAMSVHDNITVSLGLIIYSIIKYSDYSFDLFIRRGYEWDAEIRQEESD